MISAFLLNPPAPISLRLSSNLMIGIVKVYQQQQSYLACNFYIKTNKLSNTRYSLHDFFIFFSPPNKYSQHHSNA